MQPRMNNALRISVGDGSGYVELPPRQPFWEMLELRRTAKSGGSSPVLDELPNIDSIEDSLSAQPDSPTKGRSIN